MAVPITPVEKRTLRSAGGTLPRARGHEQGVQAIRNTSTACVFLRRDGRTFQRLRMEAGCRAAAQRRQNLPDDGERPGARLRICYS